ncbi:MAG: hypothetical protein PHN42_04140 [Bacilli bacterium]|nr:hypothetical protein [Bacilli bacterium]
MNNLIEKVKKIDDKLYKARYIDKNYVEREAIWNNIRRNFEILKEAIKVVKSKHSKEDTFLATAIVECMLIDYDKTPKEDPNQLLLFDDLCTYSKIYKQLIDKIYSSTDLARIVLDGYSNGGYSFLLYTLFNENLELTDNQKSFCIKEAMNKIGTTKYKEKMEDYEQKLVQKGITDDLTVIAFEFGMIGAKTWNIYMADTFNAMSTTQAHGRCEYDIRYYILKNPNFEDLFKNLVYEFFADDNDYDELVEYWTNNIINLCCDEDNNEPVIYLDEILCIEEDEIFKRLPKEKALLIIKEINFIKKLHAVRPLQWEKEKNSYQKTFI